ncbi:hypothetical protein HPB48_019640 [Haemaphysalis longicornis]|uniref:Uncharacterized protein n=1 Tax=Haemaphysalis longicornis TaxID=44386 RepID=A0A9J6GY72_HAELO|nr:hypothetical protein HPB48_019640 [Haemaphysalis longicornis]
MPPPQIIVEELSGDDQYEDVGEAPSCDRLLSVDAAWVDNSRRVRRSYSKCAIDAVAVANTRPLKHSGKKQRPL